MDSTVSNCGSDFDAAFDRNFALAGFILNRFLVHHLLRMARQTDGDFESLVIWSALALQNTAGLLGPGAKPLTPLQPDGTFPDTLLRANGLRSSDLAQITGRKPVICLSRKSVANFKLRQNQPIGCRVTLRQDAM